MDDTRIVDVFDSFEDSPYEVRAVAGVVRKD
jgi:hypothetical protein